MKEYRLYIFLHLSEADTLVSMIFKKQLICFAVLLGPVVWGFLAWLDVLWRLLEAYR